ncbi:cofilin [Serendipita sp. 396]|nr:cofilin [Serendipita sp. 396]KAG8798182.1 cofilin [Serendipita sp. 398]KAG8826186.1 cofilin [Serendipita sp. 401]KAG8831734.1 cofilin [Serendipita sp. 400]KAG8851487.1 cofilin [Serendipita sp. 411]KAG9056978.1 cofilin [Serendipita sp. 407]
MSSASGVQPDEECIQVYKNLKDRRKVDGETLKYVIYRLNKVGVNGWTIVVDKTSSDPDYETFLGDLPEAEPRWAVYDFEYDLGDAGKRNKLIFVSWSPDAPAVTQAARAQKMVFASSKDAFRRALDTFGTDIQANELDDISVENVLRRVTRA